MFLLLPQDEQHAGFEDLIDKYEKRVFNLIYRIVGDYDDAADLTQDTFVAAYRAFDSYRAEAAPYTWLYRIAANVCKNRFRQVDRRKGVEALSLDDDTIAIGEPAGDRGLTTAIPTPEKALEQDEIRRAVEKAILALPEDYRIVIVLRDLHGLTYREVAEAAELSIDVVRTRLARGREMLRRRLGQYLI